MRAVFDGFESGYCIQPLTLNFKKDGKASFEQGKQVTSVRQTGSCVTVGYRDLTNDASHELTVDLVIVAGGASCKLRSLLLPEADLQRPYSGYSTWRGSVMERDVDCTRPNAMSKATREQMK